MENSAESSQLPANSVGLVQYQDFHYRQPFTFESGQDIPEFTLRYETYGELNAERTNAILICHALSGDHHCAGFHSVEDRKPGWWDNLIGPGKAVDTRRFFVICSNCLGGCQGSTGPSSTNPQTGKPYHLSFPAITIRDMVRAQKLLIDYLEIPRLHSVIGGSMGGMQALQWIKQYPDFVERAIPMATTHRQGPQAIAFNEVGRCAIMQDPNWQGGEYTDTHGPHVGLSIARMMAHITYLSDRGMDQKFGRKVRSDHTPENTFDVTFEVESYLRYQGRSFINRFDANTYLYFTRALDFFDLCEGAQTLDTALATVQAKTLVIGFTSDWLFPPEQNREVVYSLLRARKNASYIELDMDFGHDSFLVDAPSLYDVVTSFLQQE